MEFRIWCDPQDGVVHFSGEYSDAELAGLDLDPLRRMMLDQPAESPADQLLALETIFRVLS